jgi:hypothetical protein
MPRTTTFPNGQQLISSALSTMDVQVIFQIAIAGMRGLNAGKVLKTLTIANAVIVTVPSNVGLQNGMSAIGIGIPKGATVTHVDVDGVSVTLSIAPQATTSTMVAFGADANVFTQVRVGFLTQGQPGYSRDADTSIIEANVVDEPYNRQRNERRARNDATTVGLTTEYIRCWEIKVVNYGPNSGDNARLIKSCLYLDWVHDIFASSGLYLVLDVPDPVRAPEKIAEQWWERSDLTVRYYEDIIETMIVPSIASLQIVLVPDTGPSETINIAPA